MTETMKDFTLANLEHVQHMHTQANRDYCANESMQDQSLQDSDTSGTTFSVLLDYSEVKVPTINMAELNYGHKDQAHATGMT